MSRVILEYVINVITSHRDIHQNITNAALLAGKTAESGDIYHMQECAQLRTLLYNRVHQISQLFIKIRYLGGNNLGFQCVRYIDDDHPADKQH
jgi:hypothetical protein